MSSGLMEGEKIRSAFLEGDGIGTRKGGKIVEPFPFKRQKRDFDTGEPMVYEDSGKPREQFVVTVQTDLDEGPDDDGVPDDGKRRFYFDKPSDLMRVTQAQLRKAWSGEKDRSAVDFEIGADYYVTRTGKGEAQKTQGGGKRKPPWLHSVEYTRPAPGQGKASGVFSDGAPVPPEPSNDDEPPF